MLRVILLLFAIGVVINVTQAAFDQGLTDDVVAANGLTAGSSADETGAADAIGESCDVGDAKSLGGTGAWSKDLSALSSAPSGATFAACATQVCPNGKTFYGCAYETLG